MGLRWRFLVMGFWERLVRAVCVWRSPRGGGGTQKSFIQGGSASRSNPLPFYIPFLQKRHAFRIPSIGKGAPFIYRLMNKSLKQKVFLSFSHVARNKLNETVISCVCFICFNSRLFLIAEWRFSHPFLYLNFWNPYSFIYLKPEKGTPFGRSLPV